MPSGSATARAPTACCPSSSSADSTSAAAERLIDGLRLFGLGASWGGYESLVTLANMRNARSVTDWSGRGQIIRLHIGLEDPADLLADLQQGFAALTA